MQQLKNTALKLSSENGQKIPYSVEQAETNRYELKNNEVLHASCQIDGKLKTYNKTLILPFCAAHKLTLQTLQITIIF
jgi:hypothetical protein